MHRVYDIIQKIKHKLNVYLGRPYIMCLQAFLSGYNVAQYESSKPLNTPYCFDGFQEWIQAKFKVDTSKSWANIILFYSTDERDALERFFDLFEEFIEGDRRTERERE
ncbi:MAG: hypothetical protein F6K40_32170 [Okeania sp. SIO3I5]|uniref:hypothetical protein n=1 Tax=Okeania sp. SIO3I5 TaxID=2607805 RepID=UPI0013B5C58B|nr:hypothetical protein [Okeania sp. SIO3I5]NEQ40632.1 hypothetical protein [Okeania sp. SIO3I5]